MESDNAITMTISSIKEYLKFRQQAKLEEFVRYFRAEPGSIEKQLEQFVEQGLLKKQSVSNCCGRGCDVCDTSLSEFYEIAGGISK